MSIILWIIVKSLCILTTRGVEGVSLNQIFFAGHDMMDTDLPYGGKVNLGLVG